VILKSTASNNARFTDVSEKSVTWNTFTDVSEKSATFTNTDYVLPNVRGSRFFYIFDTQTTLSHVPQDGYFTVTVVRTLNLKNRH
jgi:hypothetical protein